MRSESGILLPPGVHTSSEIIFSTPTLTQTTGTIDGTNPGTRESVVIGYNYFTSVPRKAHGLYMPTGAIVVGTDVKVRVALCSADGNGWRGSAGVSSALPLALLASDTAGHAYSTMRTNAIGASGRGLVKEFTTPVIIPPGRYWLMVMHEVIYGGGTPETQISGLGGWGDNVCTMPHEVGSTGSSRGIAWKAVQTTAIDSLSWATFVSNTASNWASAATSIAHTGRTWTGNIALCAWSLLCEDW